MAYHYSDPKRESDPHALPNVEVFRGILRTCTDCGAEQLADDSVIGDDAFPDCECDESHINSSPGWFWQACFPGCLPDGEPNGPFDSEAEALAAAREAAGFCPNGRPDGAPCYPCDGLPEPGRRVHVCRACKCRYMGTHSAAECALNGGAR